MCIRIFAYFQTLFHQILVVVYLILGLIIFILKLHAARFYFS